MEASATQSTAPLSAAVLRDAERRVRLIEAARDERDPQATARELRLARQDVEALRLFGTVDVRRVPRLIQTGFDGARVVDPLYDPEDES